MLSFFSKSGFTGAFKKYSKSTRLYSTNNDEIKVPISLIKELREKTKAGVQDCRTALVENNLDMSMAAKWLESKAKVAAEKKKDRKVAEGLLASLSLDNKKIALIEVLCETDFAARSHSFGSLAVTLAKHSLNDNIITIDDLMSSDFVKEEIDKTVFTLKENVQVRRLKIIDSLLLGSYMHQRIDFDQPFDVNVKFGLKFCGVSFNLEGGNVDQSVVDSKTIANNLAVHVFSYKPLAFSKELAPPGTNPEDILMEQEFSILGTQTVGEVWSDHKSKIMKKKDRKSVV